MERINPEQLSTLSRRDLLKLGILIASTTLPGCAQVSASSGKEVSNQDQLYRIDTPEIDRSDVYIFNGKVRIGFKRQANETLPRLRFTPRLEGTTGSPSNIIDISNEYSLIGYEVEINNPIFIRGSSEDPETNNGMWILSYHLVKGPNGEMVRTFMLTNPKDHSTGPYLNKEPNSDQKYLSLDDNRWVRGLELRRDQIDVVSVIK